jgi:hypothetical protein
MAYKFLASMHQSHNILIRAGLDWEPRPIFFEATVMYFLVLGAGFPSSIQLLLIF